MKIWTIATQELTSLGGDGKGVSLVAVATGWALLNGARMIYPVIIPYFETAYGLSLAVAGLLVAVLWFFAAVGQLPGGILADRYNERTLMALGATVVAAALVLVILSPSPLTLFLATAIWGLGHSLYPIARITFLANLYPDRLGKVLGVTMASGDIGQTVLPPIAAIFAAAFAWQMGLGFVVPLLVLVVILLSSIPSSQRSRERATSTQSIWKTLDVVAKLRTPELGLMTGILFLYMFIWQSFTAFYPTYLTTVKNLSPSVASTLFGFFFAAGVLVKPVAGAAYDRFGMRRSLVGILTPAVTGFFLLPVIDNRWSLLGITALISTMLGTGAITQSFLADSFPEEMQGTGLGVVRTVTASLAASGPVIFGVVAEYGYFNEGYVVLAVIMAAVIGLTLRMPEKKGL
jgi:MFS family permease